VGTGPNAASAAADLYTSTRILAADVDLVGIGGNASFEAKGSL
jgi:hypothetical protein